MTKELTDSSRKRIERLLRTSRQRVFESDYYCEVIIRCKELLAPTWEKDFKQRQEERLNRWFDLQ